MKAIEQYFPVVLFVINTITSESVDEILIMTIQLKVIEQSFPVEL